MTVSAISTSQRPSMSDRATSSASVSLLVPDYLRLEQRVSVALQLSRCPSARLLPWDLVQLVASFLWQPLRSVSRQLDNPRHRDMASLAMCTGWVHKDTQQYDDWTSELCGRVLAGWRLRAIECYGDRYLNGFSFTYAAPHGDSTWSTAVRKGSHHRPSLSRVQLAAGERIVQVAVRVSKWMECCVFETSAGRRFQIGGRGSRWAPKEKHATEWSHAGVTQLLLMPPVTADSGCTFEALAFTYGIGGHVHNLGVYYQPLWPRQPPPLAPSKPLSASCDSDTTRTPAPSLPMPSSAAQTAPPTAPTDDALWNDATCLSHSLPLPTTARLPLLSSS